MRGEGDRRDLPGKPIAHWNLYEEKIGADQKSMGVKAPDGKFYHFKNGEQLSFVQFPDIPGERVAVITEQDGTKRLFESWALDQKE